LRGASRPRSCHEAAYRDRQHGADRGPRRPVLGGADQRSLQHFKIGGERFPREFIRALGLVKKACAMVNRELGLLPADKADAIIRAATR